MGFIKNGRPYGPQLNKLDGDFPELERGAEISHDDIEESIGEVRTSARYKAVTRAWRRRVLNQRRMFIAPNGAAGFRVCSEREQLQFGARKIKTARRFVVSGGVLTEALDSTDANVIADKKEQLGEIENIAQIVTRTAKTLEILNRPMSRLPRGR